MSKLSQFEALLFYYGEPITLKKIASLLEIEEKEVQTLIDEFQKKLSSDSDRGVRLVVHGGMVQLLTKPETGDIIQKIMKDEFREELTPASLETLSLIAYLGPVSRLTIDFIRGVNSSFTVRNLFLRGLIDREIGKGNAYSYKPSIQFLSHLGISSVEDLPEYNSYKNIFKQFEENQQEERGENTKEEEHIVTEKL